ncbi:MAG: hypothetical protein ACFFHV_03500 [Promethearchaeota archaeon]
MTLTPNEFLNGLTGFIFVVIVFFVGLKISLKYFEYKQKTLLYVGIGWMGFPCPYIAVSVSFLSVLITGNPIPDVLYFLIGIGLIPFFLILWMAAFSELLYKNRQKLIIIIFTIFGALFESYIIYALLTNTKLIGVKQGPVDTDWTNIIIIYFVILIIIIFITGMLFSRTSLRSDNPEVRLKGKFLLVAFLAWAIGSFLDAILDYPITRIILMLSSIAFYFGWIMPDWMKKTLIRER